MSDRHPCMYNQPDGISPEEHAHAEERVGSTDPYRELWEATEDACWELIREKTALTARVAALEAVLFQAQALIVDIATDMTTGNVTARFAAKYALPVSSVGIEIDRALAPAPETKEERDAE